MHNPSQRPVFLNPLRIRLPVTALVSIAHRLTGLLLALLTPVLLYLLDLSLQGQAGFTHVMTLLQHGAARAVLVLAAWSLLHHLLAGIRFLLIDMGAGIAQRAARASAWWVGCAALVLAILAVRVLS